MPEGLDWFRAWFSIELGLFLEPLFFFKCDLPLDCFKRSRILAGGVKIRALEDGKDIGLGGGEIHGKKEVFRAQGLIVTSPAPRVGDSGVVLGQSKNFRAISV